MRFQPIVFSSALAPVALFVAPAPNPVILGALLVVCAAILIAIPVAARRGKLHMPGYSGLSMLCILVALGFGYIAGRNGIKGTAVGIALSFVFFALLAAGIGCILALAVYKRKPVEGVEE